MELLFITGLNPAGHYQECIYGGPDLESCFDVLTTLVGAGWQLIQVKHKSSQCGETWLPVEAFNDQPVTASLSQLEQEWQQVLQGR